MLSKLHHYSSTITLTTLPELAQGATVTPGMPTNILTGYRYDKCRAITRHPKPVNSKYRNFIT